MLKLKARNDYDLSQLVRGWGDGIKKGHNIWDHKAFSNVPFFNLASSIYYYTSKYTYTFYVF